MAVTTWLIDKSAYTRLAESPDAQAWIDRIQRGMVRISTVTRLEVGYSFRTAAQTRRESVSPPLALMPVEYLTPAAEDRAVRVQLMLADRGQHRGPSIPDLLVAALAEVSGLTVLALDKDFEVIAQLTGQSVERLRLA
ncbi:PIN domain nuclease [Mycobacterium shinjukuense]|uniref:Ribonuclease VapC n=1 Tax=Mycobacterium shinjukuense TaxID=398694 RepID=A0A7I7MWV2_9MYCO|nr:PIN domain nuclease [Mycobacterium shinjukuense]MCV6986314.1 PIN domain nuclease [Mycobacterium shinjukuense]ORB61992.1 VapC toxin family PIN domain ribonuclease [Mycobacterium shinjukuense]BBX75659.1 ribonuclease VapC [Mycobacterium shinjukuense]